MPWRSVAVDDGQPEHEPFIARYPAIAKAAQFDVAAVACYRQAAIV